MFTNDKKTRSRKGEHVAQGIINPLSTLPPLVECWFKSQQEQQCSAFSMCHFLQLVIGNFPQALWLLLLEQLTLNVLYYNTPHHTNCSPELQDPCTTNYLLYFEGSEFLFNTMSASEHRYLRIKKPLMTAQPQQDWGWNFDSFQWEVKS